MTPPPPSNSSYALSPASSFDSGFSTPQLSPQSTFDYDQPYGGAIPKSSSDLQRENVANMKALQLLQSTTSSGGVHKSVHRPLNTRASAARRYEQQRRQEKENVDNMIREIKKNKKLPSITKTLTVPKPLEKMATTTRKIKKTNSDERDPETVAGMMYPIEIDRQKEAEQKALRLVDSVMYIRATKEGIEVIV
mmetsp:Transcript_11967/g.20285  ORF Transcript_11967/g.20285 Transcript_11967/m.20285 type:complete len:193 (-) Transcript_11967:421-999(-)|eukprot:CAMPEP_0116552770 /NCGR_PEP_ID=MMETSP0397-20121206/6667_1 /TAXON_ID=216820 /ORGANISM="Cyclophora tenuis, Strain ECT3854" /LENGTH=192 /DNA_ID=CAMNT_0004077749 /DNA_START=57 /DNA_END=635 /DNA_ORIENTATION=-